MLFELLVKSCKKYMNIHWIIGGDGNKMDELKFVVKKFKLEERVELLGFIANYQVCSVLNRGHIFVNTSLTEAFCIAALEAASAGLLVITTNVGGTPEILPHDMLLLSEPNADSLFSNLEKAITMVKDISPSELHEKVKKYYSWRSVADRVENIYLDILSKPKLKTGFEFENYVISGGGLSHAGFFLHKIFCMIMMFFLCIFRPASKIERAINFPYRKYASHKEKWGDHNFDFNKNDVKRSRFE